MSLAGLPGIEGPAGEPGPPGNPGQCVCQNAEVFVPDTPQPQLSPASPPSYGPSPPQQQSYSAPQPQRQGYRLKDAPLTAESEVPSETKTNWSAWFQSDLSGWQHEPIKTDSVVDSFRCHFISFPFCFFCSCSPPGFHVIVTYQQGVKWGTYGCRSCLVSMSLPITER